MALSETLMVQVLVAEGILLCVALMVYFGHGVWLWWSEKRAGPKLARARATIIEALGASQLAPREINSLRDLSPQLQIKLISDIASNLSGEHLKWLAAVAEELVFRAIVRDFLARHMSGAFAIVAASALIFATIHWSHGVGALLTALFAGAALMALYMRTRSVAPCMIAHYAVNAADFL